MKIIVQRTLFSSVHIDGHPTIKCGAGMTILLGVAKGDTEEQASYLARKVSLLRIFEDEDGKMNRNIIEVGGECLVVSQFTLYGDCRKGNRPGFEQAALPEMANELYEFFIEQVRMYGITVHTGVFQTHMGIELWNDGPVTFILESH